MKTIAKYILAIGILFLAVSCESPLFTNDSSDADMVEVTMSVAFPEPLAIDTKAQMSEGPTADAFDIYLCVYGPGDGYVQNWIEPLEVTKVDSNSDGYVDKGTFKVLLPISEDRRTIHILANPPESVKPTTSDYLDNVMEKMVTMDGECAYWQQVEVNKIDAGSTIGTTGYPVASETVKNAFTNVHLVRNFAKVVVTKDPTAPFTVGRWTLINVPDRAYVAPYTGDKTKRFPDGYLNIQSYTAVGALYTQLSSTTGDNYPGSIPPEATINKDFPGDPATNPTKYAASGGAQYMYERPVPERAGEQTAVLVEVTFDETHNPGSRDDRTYWYKIEVIDNGGEYIPMFRDIVYTLKLKDLQAEGAATAQAAYNGPYFGNISASLETASLNELSDTESLIHVDVMDYTFMGAEGGSTVLLRIDPADETSPAAQYWFIPDVVNHPDDIYKTSTTDICDIKVELLAADGYLSAVEAGTLVANDGTITIKLNTASSTAIKRSIIRVSGRPGNDAVSNTKKYLYREITITLMEKQTLAVTVTPPTDTDEDPDNDKTGANKPVGFHVELPEGLSASVFPIQLRIEAEQNSLCAYSPDLPASTGPSEFTSKAGKNTYFFVYTINFSDYRYLDPDTKKYVYDYDFDFTMYTSKQGDNSTAIKIRDLGERFNTADVAL